MGRVKAMLLLLTLAASHAALVSAADAKKKECPAIECLNRCEVGYVVDEDGCTTCRCQEDVDRECAQVMCEHDCAHGYAKDARGCNTCDCLATPPVTCPKTTCYMQCPDGFEKDTNGCDICTCKKACSKVMCAMNCENGFEKDSNGCDVCKCKALPAKSCRPVLCRMYCRFGWAQDSDGCDICKCKPAPPPPTPKACRPVLCRMYCEHGWQKGEDGCEICKCNMAPPTEPNITCAEPMCANECAHGYQENEEGCLTCECKKPACGEKQLMCMMYCMHGFEKDENGCNLCKCKRPPVCPDIACMMACQHGFIKNDKGCDTCRCKEHSQEIPAPVKARPPCPEISCMMACQHGFVKDGNDCDTCRCKDRPDPPPVALQKPVSACSPVACMMHCPQGYVKDKSGCDTCRCKVAAVDCPMFKCVPCKYGYGTDENGCQNCDCLPPPACKKIKCSEGMDCVESNGEVTCKPSPVCPLHKEIAASAVPVPIRGALHVHRCDVKGDYAPKQCVNTTTCWCVDDRGLAIDGSLQTSDRYLINCDYKMTRSLHIRMLLQDEEMEELLEMENEFKRVFADEMEAMITVRREYIPNIQIDLRDATSVEIEFDVMDDGHTSLVAVSRYMTNRFKKQNFQMNYNGATLRAVPQSLVVQHHYTEPETSASTSLGQRVELWARENLHVVIAIGVLAVALVISVVIAIVLVKKRKIVERMSLDSKGPKYEKVQKV